MSATAYVDTFASDNLPPREQWPQFLFDLPELEYPDRLNCVAELLDNMVRAGYADKPAIYNYQGSWTYAELLEKVDRIAHVLRDELKLVPGNRVLLRGANNPMMAAAGPKGSTRLAWEGIDQPPESGNWPLIAASAQQYVEGVSQTARAATPADMDRIQSDFVRATVEAAKAGFDWLELHCAHGYLLSTFISPLTNQRTDEYGGSLENRCRYPLRVFAAVRAVWPQDKPISVRISAHDWVAGGITPDDAVAIARLFKQAGADMIDCSSGQVSKKEQPVYGRMFQTPFADRIRNVVAWLCLPGSAAMNGQALAVAGGEVM